MSALVPTLAGQFHAEFPRGVRKIHQGLRGDLQVLHFVVHVRVNPIPPHALRHVLAFFVVRISVEGKLAVVLDHGKTRFPRWTLPHGDTANHSSISSAQCLHCLLWKSSWRTR